MSPQRAGLKGRISGAQHCLAPTLEATVMGGGEAGAVTENK